jgi:outer membrane protein OmpA-like peptidoglycan-associated protein
LPAVNYEHLGGPTEIGFQGTVLLPNAKGEATVESKRGRILVDAKFDHMDPPTKFGSEYLTYVLWAITPEGRAKNLGEIVLNSSDKAKIDVTTDLQALGLMVTAEPYYAVSTPSDVVVLENVVLPDTIGKREAVNARYELLPRGQYTMTIHAGSGGAASAQARKLPYDRYEALLEVYQAQNAVQIAESVGAGHYAPDTFQKAQTLLQEAQQMEASRQDTHTIVSEAREAAQMAEDARAIAARRGDEERVASLQQESAADRQARERAEQARERAEAEAQQARAQADAEHAEAESQRASARQAQADAAQAQALADQREREASAAAAEVMQAKQAQSVSAQRQSRAELLAQLNGILPTRDTPRGLLVTVPDSMVERSLLAGRASRIASIVSSCPGLGVHVEGYTDTRGSDAEAEKDAQTVRELLVASGLPADSVTAAGFGEARPITSNATPAGREQNRRVEIVIAGPAIGDMALWDRAYSLR